jgi:hypothetical protein
MFLINLDFGKFLFVVNAIKMWKEQNKNPLDEIFARVTVLPINSLQIDIITTTRRYERKENINYINLLNEWKKNKKIGYARTQKNIFGE